MKQRLPCPSCPWRKSTPQGGFPGGKVNAEELLTMARGEPHLPAMQCHITPDGERAEVCVGFALQIGFESVGLRIAHLVGRYDPDQVDTDEELHDLESLLLTHGTFEPTGCLSRCRGCPPDCRNLR